MDISQKLKSIKNGKVIDEVILVVDEDGNEQTFKRKDTLETDSTKWQFII